MAASMSSISSSINMISNTKQQQHCNALMINSSISSSPATKPLIHLANTVYHGIQSTFPKLKSTFNPHLHHPELRLSPIPTTPQEPPMVQELQVYEFNERDRGSPVFLKLAQKPDKSLGDFASFTNKLYSGDLQKRLGITAGSIMYIKQDDVGGDRYEATYSFYFGDYGHISVQGPYFSKKDTYLAVTGGTGIFEGVYGKVRLHNILYPLKLHYTFYLKGIKELPREVVGKPVEPSMDAEPSIAARGLEPGATVVNFTD